ncbi:MAG TPA: sigma-70 family RNA polymerase sigma factor [Candidatus Hydrogenedentes bacterium]|nr:sigma-70 family RNA polymerase sigma factor [Candidatus Hydrogenedentota bacterium]HPG69113.1 sigma-70 family RNA polymerase sigma factor [Candidatus Hydrogenedentota bacterium]
MFETEEGCAEVAGTAATGEVLEGGVDVALVVRYCLDGDEEAKAFLFSQYATHVERAIRRAFFKAGAPCSEEDVEDIRNSLFLRLYRDGCAMLRKLRTPGSLRAWLARIASNAAVDFLRGRASAQRLRQRTSQDPTYAAEQTPADVPETNERTNLLLQALNELAAEDRLILRLRYMDKMSHREIAGLMGLNVNTASARLRRAIDKLRRVLEEITNEVI